MPAPLPKPATPPTNLAAAKQAPTGATTVQPLPPVPQTPPKVTTPSTPVPPGSTAAPRPSLAPAWSQATPTPNTSATTTPKPATPPPSPVQIPPVPKTPSPPSTLQPTDSAQRTSTSAPVGAPTQPQKQVPATPTPVATPTVAAVNPLPTQPTSSSSSVAPSVSPIPALPQQPVRIQQPPQTLTALSSMASNRLPAGAGVSVPMPAKPDDGKNQVGPNVTKTPQTPKTGQPEFAQPKKSIFRFLPFIGGGILLLLILGFVAFRFLGLGGGGTTSVSNSDTRTTGGATGQTNTGSSGTAGTTATGPKVTLEYWGLWEPTETMATVIKDYETKNPNVTIKYGKQSHQDYRVRLQNALNSENGPDLFRYHASWVPMLRQQLAAIPTSILSPSDFQNTFYPVAVNQLQSNSQLVGIPLMYDGLVLYYNTELFETAVVEPPKTWSELRTVANQLKLKSGGSLTRGGIAMGGATNVEHFSDILAVLILQNGGDLTKPDSPEVRDALLFYTNFMKTDDVWSETLPSSTVAFARGDVAMMLAPSWRAHEVKAMNPELKFATAPLPQLSDTRITWASYWAEGVNVKSTKKDEAWKFLKYLSTKEVQQKLYSDQSKTRGFGELYSRKDLANELAGDAVTSAFMQDAPFAKGWQMSSYTHDDGANDQIITYYEDAVTALLQGKQIEEVQTTLNQGVSQVLRQYGISSSTAQ